MNSEFKQQCCANLELEESLGTPLIAKAWEDRWFSKGIF